MEIKQLAQELSVSIDAVDEMESYSLLRGYYVDTFTEKMNGQFQSPTISPSTLTQRGASQNDLEHGVYQRADYSPVVLEQQINNLYPKTNLIAPRTLVFNSGMASISTLLFFLYNCLGYEHIVVGENTYFETKSLFEKYNRFSFFNEFLSDGIPDCRGIWIEYPINCTKPDIYPINRSSSKLILFQAINELIQIARKSPEKRYSIVIDYTLYFIPFDMDITRVPSNVSLFLITSLQKHRGYGLDLVNGGAITYYSNNDDDYASLTELRASMGTLFTQESGWLQPAIRPTTINTLILDSGRLALSIFKRLKIHPGVSAFYSGNNSFLTSFIFLKIEKSIMSLYGSGPFFSERLINSIVQAALEANTQILHGTSFGFPFTRIFKNSERYENTNMLRIAIGYDERLHVNMADVLSKGINRFIDDVEQGR